MIAYYDESGRILQATSDEQPLKEGDYVVVPGLPDPAAHYVKDGVFLPRPVLSPPPSQIKAGEVILLANVPAGTRIVLNGQSYVQPKGDEALELELPAGHWRIEFVPPWPWMETEFRVVVA